MLNRVTLFLLVTILNLASLPAVAQLIGDSGNKGSLSGNVLTIDGHPVPDARVDLRSLTAGEITATNFTNPDGSFAFNHVPEGQYEVEVSSGIAQTSERVEVRQISDSVTVKMPSPQRQREQHGQQTVSVRQLKVPEKASSLLDKARQAFSQGKIDRAGELLDKALATFPNYAEALTLRGLVKLNANQQQQAALDLQHAVECDPNYGMAYMVMGAVLNSQGEFQQALRPLERAATLLPTTWQVYFENSRALLGLGKFSEAIKQADKALSLDARRAPMVHLVKGYAYVGLKNYSNALPELEAFLSGEPNGANSENARLTLEGARTHLQNASAPSRTEEHGDASSNGSTISRKN